MVRSRHEPFAGVRTGRRLGPHYLDRHTAPQLLVLGVEDDTHAAGAEHAQHTKATQLGRLIPGCRSEQLLRVRRLPPPSAGVASTVWVAVMLWTGTGMPGAGADATSPARIARHLSLHDSRSEWTRASSV